MSVNSLQKLDDIKSRIYSIRGKQVMIDRDLAKLYGVETKRLNEQVRRNIKRFPEEFMFQLSKDELKDWKSQFAASNTVKMGLRKLPFVFTEQGIAMLSTVLNSSVAVDVSIQIMKAFISMRHFLQNNADVFKRLATLEVKQINTDNKVEKVLNALENKEIQPKQGIFFEGQIFDAYVILSQIIKSAEKSIVLIDNFIDESVLTVFSKRKKGVNLKILTRNITKPKKLDVSKFNEQYPEVELIEFKNSHDRFIIIDAKTIYLLGASLKDLGKKWFGFAKMDVNAKEVLKKAGIFQECSSEK